MDWKSLLLGLILGTVTTIVIGGQFLTQPRYQIETVAAGGVGWVYIVDRQTGDLYKWFGNEFTHVSPKDAIPIPSGQ